MTLGYRVSLVSGSWPHSNCQIWVPDHGVGLKSNHILAGYSYKLCATMAQYILQQEHHCQSKGLPLCWCLPFSYGSMQSIFLYQRHWNIWVKALGRPQLDLSMFNKFFSDGSLPSFCGEEPIVLATAWVVGDSQGTLWPITKLYVTHSQYCKLHLVTKGFHWGLCLPH